MNYGATIRHAWQLTWRHPFLWILGLFVPSTITSWSAGNGQRGGSPSLTMPENGGAVPPEVAGAMGEVGRWVGANWGIILAALGLLFIIGLGFLAISLIAQGGMAHATMALARGRPVTLGLAWRRGVELVWRFAGLWLILLLLASLVGLAGGVTIATLVAAIGAATEPRAPMIVLAVLLGLAMLVILVPFAVAVTITATFAQRAMAADDSGPIAGLRQGWHVLRDHLGTSALAWLIAVGLGIAASIMVGLGVVATLLMLVPPAVGLLVAGGVSASLVAYAIAALLAVMAMAWLFTAIANTFLWTYWSLIYAQLTEPPTVTVELPLAA